MTSIEYKIKQSLNQFIDSYLKIFGRNPLFSISVFAVEKGGSLQTQKIASSHYKLEDFTGSDFQELLKKHLFDHTLDLAGEIRTYNNYFPDFYHNFLRKRCQEMAETDTYIFFDLPRYSFENNLYFLIFSINYNWLVVNGYNTKDTETDGSKKTFFRLLLKILSEFLINEAKIINGDMVFDEFQINRLHGLAVSLYLETISGNASFFQSINMISSLKYEKKDCSARIALFRDLHDRPLKVRFKTPVALSKHREVRKLLAATGDKHYLVCTGQFFEGIADYSQLEATTARVFSINLVQHMTWELTMGEQLLLRCKEGVLHSNRHELQDSVIIKHIIQTLSASPEQAQNILTLISGARAANHGSILVFFASAAGEAARLSGDCFPVEPFELDVTDLLSFTVMDGALLIDTDTRCHALGVILDGTAVAGSDTSRGSRFNSALRYFIKNKEKKVLIVVVSDDGMIDFIPEPV